MALTKTAIIYSAGDEFFIGTSPSGKSITIDTNSDRHSAPTPVELVLLALGSCTAVDVISILKKKRQAVSDYRVEVFGERAEDHPRRFLKFFVRHIVSGNNIQENAVIDAIKLSEEKYCSVAATLRPSAPIETSYSILDEDGNNIEGKIH